MASSTAKKLTASAALVVIVVCIGVLVLVGGIASATGGVPSSDVAKIDTVGNIPIEGPNGFNHWYVIVNNSQQAQQGGKGKKKPPPKPDSPQGQALKTQVMEFLITGNWIIGEAAERGITVTPAEVDRQFAQTKKQSFPTEAGYKKFLKQSGQTTEDVKFRVKLEVLSNKIKQAITKGTSNVSDSEIESYYNDNKKQFSQPEQRDIEEVMTKDQAKADAAYKALQSGQPFNKVFQQYNTDPSTKATKGKMAGITPGTQDPELDKAVFSAKKSVVVKPVKTAQGYAVFTVTKIQKGSQQSLAQSKSGIKQLLVSQKQQDKLTQFQKDFKNTWRSRTLCAEDYLVPDCANGRSDSGQATPPKTPTPPGQKQPVPGESGTAPAALDNPSAATSGTVSAPAEVTNPSGDPPLAYTSPKPLGAAAQQGALGGGLQGVTGGTNSLPAALGGAPKEGAAAAGAGGLPAGIQGLGQGGAAPPAGAGQ